MSRHHLGVAAVALACASVVPASAATTVTSAAYYGEHVLDGCTSVGCTFSATSTVCSAATNNPAVGVTGCSVTVSGRIPELGEVTTATLTYTDLTGPVTLAVGFDGVTYSGAALVGRDAVAAAGTVTFSPPSGDLDPPPTRVTLTGSLQRG